jgi:hypothetical protein
VYGRLIALWLACASGEPEALAQPPAQQESPLQTTIELAQPRVDSARNLQATVTLTNAGSEPATVNLLLAPYPSVAIEVRDASGNPVPKGPPPVPPVDSGQALRTLAPGESVKLDYKGATLFGSAPPPGRYELRFRVRTGPAANQWTGELVSPWVAFEVAP